MARNLPCMLTLAVWTAILQSFTPLAMVPTASADPTIRIVRELWSPVPHRVAGAELAVEGREHLDPRRPAIYACNQPSTIDLRFVFRAAPVPFQCIAKRQLQRAPPIGRYPAAGHVFADHRRRQQAITPLENAARRIAAGAPILILPRGNRSPDGQVPPFKKGPCALALAARVPVVPIAIEGSARLQPKNNRVLTPRRIRGKLGTPTDPRAFAADDRQGLAIDLRLSLGGKPGDREAAIALAGLEGVAARKEKAA